MRLWTGVAQGLGTACLIAAVAGCSTEASKKATAPAKFDPRPANGPKGMSPEGPEGQQGAQGAGNVAPPPPPVSIE